MLQSWAAPCNGFKKCLQSLQKIKLSLQLVLNGKIFFAACVAMALRDKLPHVTCPLCNLSLKFFVLLTITQILIRFYFLQRLHGLF